MRTAFVLSLFAIFIGVIELLSPSGLVPYTALKLAANRYRAG
jgi:hypothetical protein